jgi:hypothetical protein
MRYIDVTLINDPVAQIKLTRDDTSTLFPAVVEPNMSLTITSLQTINPGLREMRFITESVSTIASIELKHPTVGGDPVYNLYYFSDDMDDPNIKPSATAITFFETLALL